MTTTKREEPAAAIDLGSNSFRLLIATPDRPMVKKTVYVGLGRTLEDDKRINGKAAAAGLAALENFSQDVAAAGIAAERIRACGTEALRRAVNGADFVRRAGEILGSKVEIISGMEEAKLTLAGIMTGLDPCPEGPVIAADIGGNSTEIIFSLRLPGIKRITSLGIGAAGVSRELDRLDIDRAATAIDTELDSFFPGLDHELRPTMILSGGSATTCGAIDLDLDEYDPEQVQGHRLTRKAIMAITDRLLRADAEELAGIRGLDPDRAGIIAGGALLCRQILSRSGADTAIISDNGLLEGIHVSIL